VGNIVIRHTVDLSYFFSPKNFKVPICFNFSGVVVHQGQDISGVKFELANMQAQKKIHKWA